jgi:hypothetical protein
LKEKKFHPLPEMEFCFKTLETPFLKKPGRSSKRHQSPLFLKVSPILIFYQFPLPHCPHIFDKSASDRAPEPPEGAGPDAGAVAHPIKAIIITKASSLRTILIPTPSPWKVRKKHLYCN